ncbi:hypothetical protein NDU88_003287 [Pleurodeles waltl]|uniref:Uncharacterized protein n=1 Tax=Pleurodeles waltl TaxID=8319 RepID=A0AAV7RDG2_PLEWA|nr:hypothetical protein NDU88_003287 [Pleurodeles waltl]
MPQLCGPHSACADSLVRSTRLAVARCRQPSRHEHPGETRYTPAEVLRERVLSLNNLNFETRRPEPCPAPPSYDPFSKRPWQTVKYLSLRRGQAGIRASCPGSAKGTMKGPTLGVRRFAGGLTQQRGGGGPHSKQQPRPPVQNLPPSRIQFLSG